MKRLLLAMVCLFAAMGQEAKKAAPAADPETQEVLRRINGLTPMKCRT